MGCASSTPMVATAGSEMLKAATHVAGDVKKQGEAAVEDATQAIGATIDTAKETVSSAVAGITNELGNAFKDGTEALDEAKHKVLEGLHLETKAEAEHEAATSTSRAPTPAVDGDGDSLKTSTPEPEIERALANSADNEEEAPPTPKPSLQEMAELSAQVSSDSAATVVASTVETTAASVATTVADSHWQRRKELEAEQLRPSTTEWEKFADQLAKSRKFKPYENFVQTKNQFSVYKDFTSLRDKPGHYDGHFSNANSMSTSASQSQSDLSSGHLTPAPPPRRHGQREYASFVGSEQPASVSRASSRLSQVGGGNNSVRTFDFNPQRERLSLPITTRAGSRVGSALNGRRSLWAREQPAVLPEEAAFSPVRRSSMVAGTGQRAFRDVQHMPAVRSTSNLTILPQKKLEKTITDARSLTTKPTKSSIRDHKPSEMFKSLFSSSSDISSALLLATPLTVTSLLHSPQPQRQRQPQHAATSPLASRAASFIADPPHNLPQTTKSTPKKAIIVQCTPSRTPKCRSPCMSRASSRLSSNSSTEIVIRPLSHLNTPSAASMSPDHVVMTEYDDSDLEAALARLTDWRGSTTTLQRPLIADSHRSSPWIRRKGEHKELPRFLNGSIVHLTSPAKTAHQLLERCEICCNEYVN